MIRKVANNKIDNYTSQLSAMLRADIESETFVNTNSIYGSIARANRALGKKWSKIIPYKKGDLVSHGLDCYVCIKDSEGEEPNNSASWKNIINEYARNRGKIKAYAIFQGGTLIDSYNIASLVYVEDTDNTVSRYPVVCDTSYEFTYTDPIQNAIILPGVVNGIDAIGTFASEKWGYRTQEILAESNSGFTLSATFPNFIYNQNVGSSTLSYLPANQGDLISSVIVISTNDILPVV